ncbi:MAG: hypothetical protein V3T99_03815 [Nitrososphaerales archaeon]
MRGHELIRLRSEEGSILGIALIYFVVFSITGLGVLTFAWYFRKDSLDESHSYINKYAAESMANLAIWRANTGPDSLANFEDNGAISVYDSSTRILTVNTNRWDQPHEISVELDPIHTFERCLSYTLSEGDTTKGSITYLFNHRPLRFRFLPDFDITYYKQNAVQIHTGESSLKDTLPPGIHYVDGGEVTLRRGAYLAGSLVITNGGEVFLRRDVTVRSIQDSSGAWIPAIIVDSTAVISFNRRSFVYGAVFSERKLNIKGTFTGPIVAPEAKLNKQSVIDDLSSENYYNTWPPGFGELHFYDWPKRIKKGTWR